MVLPNPFDSIICLWWNYYNIVPINLEAQEATLPFIPGWKGLRGFWNQASHMEICDHLGDPSQKVRINITEIIRINFGFVSGRCRRHNSLHGKLKNKKHTAQSLLKMSTVLFLGPQLLKIPALGWINVETHSERHKGSLQLCRRAHRTPCWTAVCWQSPVDLCTKRKDYRQMRIDLSHHQVRDDLGAKSRV